jgi:predicted amidohydrolase YtcJ
MRGMRYVMAAVLAGALSPASAGTTVVTAATIRTMDPARPLATALAFDDAGRIVAVGDASALRARFGDARHVDLGGATVVPGG